MKSASLMLWVVAVSPPTSTLEPGPKYMPLGLVKKMMREAIPLYEKMGMKKINAYANIDAGAYAWSRYGFNADKPAAYASAMGKAINSESKVLNKAKKLTPEAKGEVDAIKAVLAEHKKNPELPTILTSIKTPHLDAGLHSSFPEGDVRRGASFLSWALKDTEFDGHVLLNDERQMAHLNTYIGKVPKKA